MNGTNKADNSADGVRALRDGGITFIEVLVAVVLLGTLGLGVLAAMRATVIGTQLERDHARAYQWLQSADGVLQQLPRERCDVPVLAPYTTAEEQVRGEYQAGIQAQVVNPPGWESFQLTVVRPVKVWDGTQYWDPYDPAAPDDCFDDADRLLQLITLEVTSPDGDIIETIEVVKRD